MHSISTDTYNLLNAIPLPDVMARNGHRPVFRAKNRYFYRCPLPTHTDNDASFCVECKPGDKLSRSGVALAAFSCNGCKNIMGYGAVSLQAQLLGIKECKGNDYWRVIEKLSKEHDIPLDGVNLNSSMRRYTKVDPQDEFSWTETEFSDFSLRMLGCESDYADIPCDDDRSRVEPFNIYSWGSNYYDHMYTHRRPNFDPSDISRVFGVYPVSDFTLAKKQDVDGQYRSSRFRATDSYPIFIFKFSDRKGHWAIKKYEPLARPDEEGRDYKWRWFFQSGYDSNIKPSELLFGDNDVMASYYDKNIEPCDTSLNHDHPVIDCTHMDKNMDVVTERKFKRIIVCSGPRDGMNVYYHSDAHVVYPLSESVHIDFRVISRLQHLAAEVYVLFDMDDTGMSAAHHLNRENLYLRTVRLPEDLSLLSDSRTGRPCNDATDYFTKYPSVLEHSDAWKYRSINEHFESLLTASLPLVFWERHIAGSKARRDEGVVEYRYDILSDSLKSFLYEMGMRTYVEGDGVNRNVQFILLRDNIFQYIPEGQVLSTARMLCKTWLVEHPAFYDQKLANTIASSKLFTLSLLAEIPSVNLQLESFGPDFEHFFFANGAVRVDKEGISLVPYDRLNFHVNDSNRLGVAFSMRTPLFEIVPDEHFEEYEREHRRRMDEIDPKDKSAIRDEQQRFEYERRIYQYRLILKRPMNEMPPVFQFLYDTGRVFWREELEQNLDKPMRERLSVEKRRFQDAQFINKMAAIGYALCRFRESSHPYMVQAVDYRVDNESKNIGRNGKSLIGLIMGMVRNTFSIPGKSFKVSAESVGKNFAGLQPMYHQLINIDDLRKDINPEVLFNMSVQSIPCKSLYHDEYLLPLEKCPKIYFSCNRLFDTDDASTQGRLYPIYICDYYHESVNGEPSVTPRRKFGMELTKQESHDDYQDTVMMLMQAAQFYLLHSDERILAPKDSASLRREAYASVKDDKFVEWALKFFDDDTFLGVPIPKIDLIVSYFRWMGKDVNRESVYSYAHAADFGKKMKTFCRKMGIRVNPDSILTAGEIRNGMLRCKTYTYDFDDRGRLRGERQKRDGLSCYIFFRQGSEPERFNKDIRDVKTDPGCEGYLLEE